MEILLILALDIYVENNIGFSIVYQVNNNHTVIYVGYFIMANIFTFLCRNMEEKGDISIGPEEMDRLGVALQLVEVSIQVKVAIYLIKIAMQVVIKEDNETLDMDKDFNYLSLLMYCCNVIV